VNNNRKQRDMTMCSNDLLGRRRMCDFLVCYSGQAYVYQICLLGYDGGSIKGFL